MLCTPPAFILSQDQTLECFVLSRSLERYNHLRAFSLLFYFYFVCVFSLEFVRVLLRTFVFALYFSQADSLCFVVQFSMTGARSFPPGAVSVLRRLDYYITSHPACQAFFQTFSDFFSRLFLRSRVRFVRSLSLFPTAPILYPFSSPLSTLFSHLFWFFEKSFLRQIFLPYLHTFPQENAKQAPASQSFFCTLKKMCANRRRKTAFRLTAAPLSCIIIYGNFLPTLIS